MATRHSLWAASCAAATPLIPVAAAGAQADVRPGFTLFTVEQDVEVGRQSVVQIARQLPVLSGAPTQRYVSAPGVRLGKLAPARTTAQVTHD